MRPNAPVLVLVNLIVLGQLGCARTAEDRQLDSMRAEIDRIQEERDGTELQAAAPERLPPKASVAPPPLTGTPPAPAAEVVRVGTTDEVVSDDYADPEDTTPRPSIRISGGSHGRASRQGDDQADLSGSDDPASARPTPLDPDAKRAYDSALSLVNAKQYDRALEALAAFLVKWPDHPYADHAMFWRGECYFAQGDFTRASEEFRGMLARFPASAKAPDALLTLGICYQKRGQATQAKECFDRLTEQYPQADAARRIPTMTVPAAAPSGPASEDHR